MSALVLEHSGVVPGAPAEIFDRFLPIPLEQIFGQRFLAIAPVVGTEQDGVWGTVGQTRVVRQADGTRMREELTSVERPHAFGYAMTVVRGPLKLLAGSIAGEWRFEADGTGTRITWSWTVEPSSDLVAPLLPVLRPLWQGYARKGFERIATLFG